MTENDGRHDFDFVHGRWRIQNRKLAGVLERECTEWVEFEATSEARPILGGLGNMDSYSSAPPSGALDGITLRLFDPGTRLWRIWWASTTRPGHMDPPVEGRFTDGHGRFFCDDVLNGERVKVRFDWRVVADDSARWEQAFSYDEGRSWKTNWVMDLTRSD
jgi:hypothetical protein